MNYEKVPEIKCLLNKDWLDVIDEETVNDTQIMLNSQFENCKNESRCIFPNEQNDIFKVFNLCSLNDIKVVIIGQDPYHNNKFQANGIAFSVNKKVIYPPSLRNIFKELNRSLNINCTSGDISEWVKQGVFLMNTVLTVTQSQPGSHKKIWSKFTDEIIKKIQDKGNVIFCLWGKYAEEKEILLTNKTNIILKCSHPSPLSAYKTDNPFIGSDIFNKINEELIRIDKTQINWDNTPIIE